MGVMQLTGALGKALCCPESKASLTSLAPPQVVAEGLLSSLCPCCSPRLHPQEATTIQAHSLSMPNWNSELLNHKRENSACVPASSAGHLPSLYPESALVSTAPWLPPWTLSRAIPVRAISTWITTLPLDSRCLLAGKGISWAGCIYVTLGICG